MRVQLIDIPYPLKGYIENIWFFESNRSLPATDDRMLVAPNGLIRLVIPCQNRFSIKSKGQPEVAKENEMLLVGICDLPLFVDFKRDEPSAMIGVQFSPLGSYHFFHIRQREIKNHAHMLTDVLGKRARQAEEQIANAGNIDLKVKLLKQFLFDLFVKSKSDLIFEYCVNQITCSKGSISVKRLENETGYSSRWLNRKFDEQLGVSPKNLCSILRFHHFYSAMMKKDERFLASKAFFDFYFDQSHFIKDFKRFTGLTPTQFENINNNFCKLFYIDYPV